MNTLQLLKEKNRLLILSLIQGGLDSVDALVAKSKFSPATVRCHVRALEDMGCISSDRTDSKGRHGGVNPKKITFITEDTYVRVEDELSSRKESLPFDRALSAMMGYTDIRPINGNQVRQLDKLVRPEPLRKLNLAWHGYSCEISV
jgi:DNA-binding transcriptional ArsR family regulator